jgi:outer membrane receptor protein involved in Fe transport
MSTPSQLLGLRLLLVAALGSALGFAQPSSAPVSVSPADLAPYDRNQNGRLDPDEVAAKAAAEARTAAAVTLSPFEVVADPTDTYEAHNTNSVTGTNTPLNKTPLDAKVFNRQMLDELGAIDMTDMLWKIGGLGPSAIGAGEEVRGTLEGDRQDPKSMSMRGMLINNPRRDGFLRSETTLLDSFDIERVEAIGGSNSLLFGAGDAGGVVNSSPKRAYLNRRPTLTVRASGDSEGSRRYTLDAQAGSRLFALRFNAVKGDMKFFRPGTAQEADGYHVAATFQPWKRITLRGEYRHFSRDTIFSQAVTVRAPLNLLLPNGERVDNQSSRYLAAFPNVALLTGGAFDLTKADSAIGPFYRDAYENKIRSIVLETTLAEGLALQLRYGHDNRVNQPLRCGTTVVYAPGATGNNYVDPATGLRGTQWSMQQMQYANPYWAGSRGYRVALAGQRNFGKWGRHQANLFRQDMWSWTNQQSWRFYEADASGNIIQNLANVTNAETGRNAMPSVWVPAFPDQVIGGQDWVFTRFQHPNGKTYVYAPQIYSGAVAKTANNPLGLSGPINPATGETTSTIYFADDTRETSWGASLFSEWWQGRIDSMIGLRREEASGYRNAIGIKRGPLSYDGITTGVVANTPIKDLRLSANYATNGRINFNTVRDIFNQPLPGGKGESRDVGLKFDLFERRLSGAVTYYVSEGQNYSSTLTNRDDIDPAGINGRNGGNAYVYDRTSDGYSITLSARPLRGWEMRFNFATANGSERSNVVLPQFYNDQFNTMTVGGQTVVGVKASATATVVPLMVPEDPANAASRQVPLSLAMMKDPTSPYYAQLDRESGQILNPQALHLDTPGVGTNVTGLPIADHQLGFTSPSGGSLIVRLAGERTVGYAERSYSLLNRYQFSSGFLRGLVAGLGTTFQEKFRAYMYNDAADGGKRKTFYFPNRFLNDLFLTYGFKAFRQTRASVQLNVANLFDRNQVLYLPNSTNGTLRYAQWFNAPRKLSLSTSVTF